MQKHSWSVTLLSFTFIATAELSEKLVITLNGPNIIDHGIDRSSDEDPETWDFISNNAYQPVIVNPFAEVSDSPPDLLDVTPDPSSLYLPLPAQQRSKVAATSAKAVADWQRNFPPLDPLEASMTSRATIRVGQTLVVHLPVKPRPHREFVWKLNVSYDDSTFLLDRDQLEHLEYPASASLQFLLDNSGYVSPKPGETRAHQQFVFRGMEPGVIKLPFLYNRPWFSDGQPGGAASFVWARVIPRKSVRSHASRPVRTERLVTMLKGQQIDIKLGNSAHMPYNLWKLMEIFDANTGHIIPGPDQPSYLEFVFRDSGYIPPETSPSGTNTTSLGGAGYQVFTIFARAVGKQRLRFAFVKPWLPDEQFDRTDIIIDITIKDNTNAVTSF